MKINFRRQGNGVLMQKVWQVAVIICLALVAGCTGVPEGVEPVTEFDRERYLGR